MRARTSVSSSRTGRLTKADLARGMPPGDPIFSGPPYYWRDMERLVLTWRTDLEACLRVCPDCMEVDESATARLILYNFHFCTVGPYHEASLQFRVNFEGDPYWFECKNLVDSDAGFAAGREVFGIPKKMGWFTWGKAPETGLNIQVGRGTQLPLLTASFIPQTPSELGAELSSLTVRVIPTGVGGDPDIQVFNGFDPDEAKFEVGADGYVFHGFGTLAFNSRSLFDPWHEFDVREMLDAQYLGGSNSLTMGNGAVLKKY
jgi:acetoacetate decarboxylase